MKYQELSRATVEKWAQQEKVWNKYQNTWYPEFEGKTNKEIAMVMIYWGNTPEITFSEEIFATNEEFVAVIKNLLKEKEVDHIIECFENKSDNGAIYHTKQTEKITGHQIYALYEASKYKNHSWPAIIQLIKYFEKEEMEKFLDLYQ